MPRFVRNTLILLGLAVGVIVAMNVLGMCGVLDSETWTREAPLVSAIAVKNVRDGILTLADGRSFRPAGVRRRDTVEPKEYDHALRIVVAQGVVITRDLGDGRAFLLAEPKFYNWCGTRGYGGNPWGHWAGGYFQCPVSELLICSGNAIADLDEAGFTPRERWRLEGASELRAPGDKPISMSDRSVAFRFDGIFRQLGDYETSLEVMWKAPPSP